VGEDLDVAIAQRAFEKAVALLDKATAYLEGGSNSLLLRNSQSFIKHIISLDKSGRQARALQQVIVCKNEALTTSLSSELDRPGLRAASIRSTVYLLLRLGQDESVGDGYNHVVATMSSAAIGADQILVQLVQQHCERHPASILLALDPS
jgi:hypothetical protein